MDAIHHHHHFEESYYFGVLEEKLGEGTLSGSKEQHSHFVPQLENMEKWIRNVQNGSEEYDAQIFLNYISSFSDAMVEHMNDVSSRSFQSFS